MFMNSSQLSQNDFRTRSHPLTFLVSVLFFQMFFLSLVRIPFFIAPKLSQNNFENKIVWEVLVGEVLVVGEVVGEFVAEVVGAVLVVGEVVGEFVGEVVGAVLVGAVLVGAVLVGI